jgi:hypothetical protein
MKSRSYGVAEDVDLANGARTITKLDWQILYIQLQNCSGLDHEATEIGDHFQRNCFCLLRPIRTSSQPQLRAPQFYKIAKTVSQFYGLQKGQLMEYVFSPACPKVFGMKLAPVRIHVIH